jgi:hypothetical protein
MTAQPGFDEWYESLGTEWGDGEADEDAGQSAERLRRWLHQLYETHGGLDMESVKTAFLLDQIQISEANVAVVLQDIENTSALRPDIVVDDYEGGVRVAFDGSYALPSVTAWENPEALAEVADYLQERVMEKLWAVWPTCPRHGFGVFAQVHGGVAMWWCRFGQHGVAAVGLLGLGRAPAAVPPGDDVCATSPKAPSLLND